MRSSEFIFEQKVFSDKNPKLVGLSYYDLEKLSESAADNFKKFDKNISKKLNLSEHKGIARNTLNLYSVYRKQKIYEAQDKKLSDTEKKLFDIFNSRAVSTIDSVKPGDNVCLLTLSTLSIPNDKIIANLHGFLNPKQIKAISNSNGIDYLHFVDGSKFPETDGDPIHLAQSWAMTKLFDSSESASKTYLMYALEGNKLSNKVEFVLNVDSKLNEEINEKVFKKPFYKEKQYGKYLLIAEPGRLLIHQKITDPSDQFRIEAKLGKQTIGWVNFEQQEDHLEALDLWVDPKHRRRGIATAMYRFAKELGNDIQPSKKQTASGKEFWSKKSPLGENEENTVTLNQLYRGNFPDRDESFWDYVRKDELNSPLNIYTLDKNKLKLFLLSQYRVEHIDELVDLLNNDQKQILKKYSKDPNLSQKIILVCDGRIIDGNHRALAAAIKGASIKYIDLADLEDKQIDESNDLGGFKKSLANAVRGRISQMQADAAIAKAQGKFEWDEGDIIYSSKTGKTYTITGLTVIKNRPMYYYSRDDQEGNLERGMFYADVAHKTLKKIGSKNEDH